MVNKVILIGNLGADPEVKEVNGQKVASFSVATSESWKDKTSGEKKTATEWHNIIIWGALAGVVESYLKKGAQVYLEGKSTNRSWEHEGAKHYRTEIVCNSMKMLGGKSEGVKSNDPGPTQPEGPAAANNGAEDDLPF